MERLSSAMGQQEQQVQWRRDKVQELCSKGIPKEKYLMCCKLEWLLSIETYHILGMKPKPTSKYTLTSGCQRSMRNVLWD
ncbi:MAG: hypothetical protein ACJ72V_05125 [Nitrososphaeraceae archaeon]